MSHCIRRFRDVLKSGRYLRDWLTTEGLKGKQDIEMPETVVQNTADKYREAFEMLVGRKWEER